MSSMGSCRAVAAALIAALVCVPMTPVVAQPQTPQPAPPNDKQMTQAKDLVNKAITKSQAGDHAAAIELYLNAYNIAPLPLLLSNIGSEYQQAGKPVDALKYFCKYLEAEPNGPNASYATAQAKVLQTGLHNTVDDANVCKPPTPVPVGPGSGSATAAGSGSDVTSVGTGSAAGMVEQPPPADPGRTMRYAGIGAGALGVALASLGLIYGSKAATISDSITNHPAGTPWPDDIAAQEAEGQSDENKQIGFLVAGGVAITAGVVIYVMGRNKSMAAEHMAVVPTAAPGYAGVALVGGW